MKHFTDPNPDTAPGGGALADLKQLQDRGALGALLRTPALNEALVELLWPAVQTLQRAAAAVEPLTEPLTEPPHKSAASAAVATKVRFADLWCGVGIGYRGI